MLTEEETRYGEEEAIHGIDTLQGYILDAWELEDFDFDSC